MLPRNVTLKFGTWAGWLEHKFKPFGESLLVVSGLRYDYDRRLSEGVFDPRLTVRYGAVPKVVTVKAGAGWFSQRPSPDESDPDFGNPDINTERSIHYSAGVEWQLSEYVELDMVGFYKDLFNLVGAPAPNSQAALEPSASGRILTNDGQAVVMV